MHIYIYIYMRLHKNMHIYIYINAHHLVPQKVESYPCSYRNRHTRACLSKVTAVITLSFKISIGITVMISISSIMESKSAGLRDPCQSVSALLCPPSKLTAAS